MENVKDLVFESRAVRALRKESLRSDLYGAMQKACLFANRQALWVMLAFGFGQKQFLQANCALKIMN